jgi:hypothetical protein
MAVFPTAREDCNHRQYANEYIAIRGGKLDFIQEHCGELNRASLQALKKRA